MKPLLIIASALILTVTKANSQPWQTYPYTPSGSLISFPADDGKHISLNTTTEWWYINLHLIGSAPAYKQYDVMLCYFSMPANMRIFNIADPETGIFHTDVNQTPLAFFQQTGHWELTYTIPFVISDYSNWTYPNDGKKYSYIYHAESPNNNDALDVTVTSNRIPLIVGGDGFIPIGTNGDSSFYYSYTNMKVQGSIKFAGVTDYISSGVAWIDRQYGPFTVGINTSNMYEWYSLQLDEPGSTLGVPQRSSEFNIWQIYTDSNNIPFNPQSRSISGLYSNNVQDTTSNFIFERKSYWHDVANSTYYSQNWRLIDPAKGMCVDMDAAIIDQVIDVTLFKFWEGSTKIKGTVDNLPVDGLGFAELVTRHTAGIVVPSVPANLAVNYASNNYSLSWSASSAGTYPLGGYRVYRSLTNDGHWQYVATTNDLFYTDAPEYADAGYYYTVSSFDDQTATSASDYSIPVHDGPLPVGSAFTAMQTIKLFPNPAKDKIIVELPDFNNTLIEISTLEGQILQSQILLSSKTAIDVSELRTGIYLVKVKNDTGTLTRKIIKT